MSKKTATQAFARVFMDTLHAKLVSSFGDALDKKTEKKEAIAEVVPVRPPSDKISRARRKPREEKEEPPVRVIKKNLVQRREEKEDYEEKEREERTTEAWAGLDKENKGFGRWLRDWSPVKKLMKKMTDVSFVTKTVVPVVGMLYLVLKDLTKSLHGASSAIEEMLDVDEENKTFQEDVTDEAENLKQHNDRIIKSLADSVVKNNEGLSEDLEELGAWLTSGQKSGEHETGGKIDIRTKDKTAEQIENVQKKLYEKHQAKAVYEYKVEDEKQREKARYLLEKGYTVQPTAGSDEAEEQYKDYLEQLKKEFASQLRLKKGGGFARFSPEIYSKFNEHLDVYLKDSEDRITRPAYFKLFKKTEELVYSKLKTAEKPKKTTPPRVPELLKRPDTGKVKDKKLFLPSKKEEKREYRQKDRPDEAKQETKRPVQQKIEEKEEKKSTEADSTKKQKTENFVEKPPVFEDLGVEEIVVPNEHQQFIGELARDLLGVADILKN